MARLIDNAELAQGDLPPPGAPENAVWAFARTFDGYKHVECGMAALASLRRTRSGGWG